MTEGARSYTVLSQRPMREPAPQLEFTSLSAALNQSLDVVVTLSQPAPSGDNLTLSAADGLVSSLNVC